MRIGHGYDVHAFCDGSFVTLCGVKIPYKKGFRAHSDGDVALHALCDALLGAAALGDIGRHFPDNDKAYLDIDSRILLRDVVQLLAAKNLAANNVDITIVAQAPKMAPHIDAMRKVVAQDLCMDIGRVNVKATTSEGLGFTGREEGIAASAVVTLLETVRFG